MNTPDVLRKAASIIEQRGWCRGRDIDGDGTVCANGALRLAVGQEVRELPVSSLPLRPSAAARAISWPDNVQPSQVFAAGRHINLAHDVLDAYLSRHRLLPVIAEGAIIAYNDRHAQSGAEVCAVMRNAANELENGVIDAATWIVDQAYKKVVPLPEFTVAAPEKEAVPV